MDDSRKTLQYVFLSLSSLQSRHLPIHLSASYAVSELQADVERALEALPESERDTKRAKFAIFVVHNKLKPKLAELSPDLPCVYDLPRSVYRRRVSEAWAIDTTLARRLRMSGEKIRLRCSIPGDVPTH